MLISKSYFNGERDVPNTNYPDGASALNDIIKVREREYLLAVLGYDLYKKFYTSLLAQDGEQRMLDLLFGKDYTGYNGLGQRWEGFAQILATTSHVDLSIEGRAFAANSVGVPVVAKLQSPICDHTFFYWLRKKRTNTNDTGESKAEEQNATGADAKKKSADTWNAMVEKNLKLDEFMRIEYATYPEYQLYTGDKELRYMHTKINPYF